MRDAAPVLILAAVALGLPLVWLIATYNIFVRLRQHLRESWSAVETELQRRYDLIPNIVEAVAGYARHEQATFERVVQLRNQAASNHGDPESQARDENALIGGVKQLLAVAEAYPDLKANTNFLHLQKELTNTEDRIQAARRFYNANVRDMNTRAGVFPSNIVAAVFGVRPAQYFEIEDSVVRAAPQVRLSQAGR
jgi:LemA protein